jgi:hypothetical protein
MALNKRTTAKHSHTTKETQNLNAVARNRFGTILKINKDFLLAALFGFLAWRLFIAPSDFYGVTLLAVVYCIIAVAMVIGAIIQIVKLYVREKALTDYLSQGTTPKFSSLAGGDALDKAGMRE